MQNFVYLILIESLFTKKRIKRICKVLSLQHLTLQTSADPRITSVRNWFGAQSCTCNRYFGAALTCSAWTRNPRPLLHAKNVIWHSWTKLLLSHLLAPLLSTVFYCYLLSKGSRRRWYQWQCTSSTFIKYCFMSVCMLMILLTFSWLWLDEMLPLKIPGHVPKHVLKHPSGISALVELALSIVTLHEFLKIIVLILSREYHLTSLRSPVLLRGRLLVLPSRHLTRPVSPGALLMLRSILRLFLGLCNGILYITIHRTVCLLCLHTHPGLLF